MIVTEYVAGIECHLFGRIGCGGGYATPEDAMRAAESLIASVEAYRQQGCVPVVWPSRRNTDHSHEISRGVRSGPAGVSA